MNDQPPAYLIWNDPGGRVRHIRDSNGQALCPKGKALGAELVPYDPDKHPSFVYVCRSCQERLQVLRESTIELLVHRLNALIETPAIRADIQQLIETRIPVCNATGNHPDILTEKEVEGHRLGFMGLLNGLLAAAPPVEPSFGPIAAIYDDRGLLVRFRRV